MEKLEDEKKSLSDCASNFCQQLLEAKVTVCDLREELVSFVYLCPPFHSNYSEILAWIK